MSLPRCVPSQVQLKPFAKALKAVERSHRLTSRILSVISGCAAEGAAAGAAAGAAEAGDPCGDGCANCLSVSYEELLGEHEPTVRRVLAFLKLGVLAPQSLAAGGAAPGAAPDAPPNASGAPKRALRKATADQLCEAIGNYAELCEAYAHTSYAQFFQTPCRRQCGGVG